jgi:transcriptional regulator with XRE-family HTH domain
VSTTPTADRRFELGDFLRRRRESITPEAAGIVDTSPRRTPGLRRGEVAERANISAVYYERLEQGRGAQPSIAVLESIARALSLRADEQDHLYRLAGLAPLARIGTNDEVDPGLLASLRAVAPLVPAAISDELGTVLAQNPINVALFDSMAGCEQHRANMVWRWFTDINWRHWQEPAEQHGQTGQAYVSDLRAVVTRRDRDPRALELVSRLRAVSEEFASFWDEHKVATLHCQRKQIKDERFGRIDLDCAVMLSPLSDQRLMLLYPAPGTPAQDRLARLFTSVKADPYYQGVAVNHGGA